MGKFLGYTLIVAIFVTAAYYLAVGQKGGKGIITKKEKTVATKSDSSKVTPTPPVTKISVFAAGTPASGEYPTMVLKIDGAVVQTWKGVKGEAGSGKFDEFTYNFPGVISGQVIEVGFTNDLYIAADEDRNLYVDRIVVGENTFVADSPATLTTITDKTNKKCSDGKTYSRWLLCNGHFTFRSFDKAFVPLPTPVATAMSGSVVRVYAAGNLAGGERPTFDLYIKDRLAASFRVVGGEPSRRVLGEYSYQYPEKVKAAEVKIVYMNDWYEVNGSDRNLFIDRINIDGQDFFADAPSVYVTGIWTGGKCSEGYLRSKLLWCPNATMKFEAREIKK